MKKIIKWTSVIIALAAVCVTVLALIPGKNAVKTVAGNLMKDVFASAPASESAIPGDVDGNGIVNIRDSARLLLYIAGKDVDCLNAALDADGNGIINNDDASAILKSITGWDASLSYGDPCAHAITSYEYVAPTCTEGGKIAYFSCDTCGKLFKDEECVFAITSAYTEIAPDGHVEAIDSAVEPTCGTCGYTEGSHCAVCGAILEDQKEIEATGDHDFSAIGNEWIGTANFVQSVCAICRAPSGVQFEGGFSEETNTLMLRECGSDFTFDIVCSENESYIREKLTVVESMFSSLEGELLDAFANEYELEKLGGDVWRVSPAKPYDERMGYDVLFDGGIELADFPGRSLSFRTSGSSSDVEVYRNDILFLRDFENRDPGYYPYTISFDEDAMQYTLTVSKSGIFTEDLIGRVLCVGECIDMETASNMSSDEVDIGKITAIETTESGAVITLGPVDFTDIYAELDVTLGDKEMTVTETLTEEERMLYAASILTNESFLSALNTAQLAAEDYAAPYGLNVGKVDWVAEAKKLVSMIKITLEEKVIKGNSGALLTVGIDNFTISIPIESSGNYTLATVKFTFTLKDEFELYIDGKASTNNLEYYIQNKIDIFHKDDVKAQFHAELHSINTFTFNFGVSISSDISEQIIYYVVNPNTGTIHADFCKHARKYADDINQCYTAKRLEEDFGKNYADKQCQSCKPFTDNQSFAICLTDKYATVHKNTCSHIPTIKEENLYYTHIRPVKGSKVGNLTYDYCADCNPSTAESKSFDECMKDSLESSDWGESLLNLRDKIAGALDYELSPQKDPDLAVKLWIFSIKIKVTPVIKFNLEASLEYSFVDISKDVYIFDLRYLNDLKKYDIVGETWAEDLTKEEKDKEENVIDVKGKIDASAGIRLDISLGPVVFDDWFNINLRTEVGFYADLRGVAHIDFNNKNENYFGGFVKVGIYGEMSASYVAFGYKPPERLVLLPNTRVPIVAFGNGQIFYGYDDYDQSVSIKSSDKYTLDNALLKALYFDLEEMSASSKELSFSGGSGYKVIVNVVDESGKALNYCMVNKGVLHIGADAPSEFTAYLKIKVLDTDLLTFDDLIDSRLGDELDTSYTLPELTVKISYNRGITESVKSVSMKKGDNYAGNADEANALYLMGQPVEFTVITNAQAANGVLLCIDNVAYGSNYIGEACEGGLKYTFTDVIFGSSGKHKITVYALNKNGKQITVKGTFVNSEIEILDTSKCTAPKITSITEIVTQGNNYPLTWKPSIHPSENVEYSVYLMNDTTGAYSQITVGASRDYAIIPAELLQNIGTYSVQVYANYTGTDKEIAQSDPASMVLTVVEAKKASEGLEFTLNDDGTSYSVTGMGTCTDADVVIPSTYNGLPVTRIGYEAFRGRTRLTAITIPNSVKYIDYYAFRGCSRLTAVSIPDSVTSIGGYAFYGCSSLTTVIIPNSVTSIGEYAFSWCANLTAINIPDSVTSIGNNAFESCSSLTRINISNGVTSIGDNTFVNCLSLTSITIPNSVTSIGNSAFSGCSSLTTITIPDGVASIGDSAFSGCSSLTTITIPDGVASIGHSAFYECSSLTTITIPAGVTSIGHSAFYECSSLTTITIPAGVTSIGHSAFYECSSLTTITIPDSVTSIGSWTFYECSSLTTITIPDSVTSIDGFAFDNCTSLTNITIPDSVTFIGAFAFDNCTSLTSITIPVSVTSIDGGAFSGCRSLTSITIPDSVTFIGAYAFRGCTSLTSINIPNSVTSIDKGAFSNCTSLTSIIIPDSVTSINCSSLFYGCSSLTSVTFPDSVTSIGDQAFGFCESLTSITIPSSVTRIGKSAFFSCSSLTSINFTGTISEWNAIEKGSNWHGYAPFTVVHCTDGDVNVN